MFNVELAKIKSPEMDCSHEPIVVSDKTIEERKEKLFTLMDKNHLDCLFIYADLEHGNNFEYLVGFLPRFEEAVLIFHRSGEAFLLLGNENLNKANKARIAVKAIHVPYFSLPNQPMEGERKLADIYAEAKISSNTSVGVVGWKLFTGSYSDEQSYDLPHYLIEPLKQVTSKLSNATNLFIGEKGARTTNNVEEIACYEYYSALASDCILKTMDYLDEGVSELELGSLLNADGQRNSVVTIAASGPRFIKANMYPTNKKVQYGDAISLSIGYRGGLSSRSGYAATIEGGIKEGTDEYLENLVYPYFNSIATWLEKVHCGMKGEEVYSLIEEVLPKEKYHWFLNPGHLTAYEEWLASPIYPNSKEVLKSGMLFQTDIIPSIKGFAGTSVESTVLLADEKLRDEIKEKYPVLFNRFMKRREYIIKELNIELNKDLLPMASTLAYLRPFLLDKEYALRRKK